MSDIELLKQQIINNVVMLVCEKKVKQRELFASITKALEKASEQNPKVPILYNATYGDFGTSEYFDIFFEEKTVNDSHNERYRVQAARLINSFGKHVAETFPNLYELVYILHHTNLQSIVSNANRCNHFETMITTVKRNKEELEDHLSSFQNNVETNKKPSEYCFKDKYCCWWSYKNSDLVELNERVDINKIISEYKNEISKINIDLPSELKPVLLNFTKEFQSKKTHCKSFMDLILQNEYDSAWSCQHFFDVCAISFLYFLKTIYPELYLYFRKDIVLDDKNIFQLLGLLAASGNNSMLSIDYVPNFLDWHVSDYDGKETIEYLA
jgi:hypothetical protein